MNKHALIVGASGLVGGQLLAELLQAPDFNRVTALLRRPLPFQHPKLEQLIVDFEHLKKMPLPFADAVFCCLGTTLKAAGSRQAFRRVDHDYVIDLAHQAQQAGGKQFLLVSSTGADDRSMFFYMRVKGQTESALREMQFSSCTVFRPAYLVGQRALKRPFEDMYGHWMQRLACLIPVAYRPVSAQAVARAMLAQARLVPAGFHEFESAALQRFESHTVQPGVAQP